MDCKKILIIVVIIISGWIICQKNKKENFSVDASNSCKLEKRYHARLNDMGALIYVSEKPPCTYGEGGCFNVRCPERYNLDKDVVCWMCPEIIAQPEHD